MRRGRRLVMEGRAREPQADPHGPLANGARQCSLARPSITAHRCAAVGSKFPEEVARLIGVMVNEQDERSFDRGERDGVDG